MIKKELADLSEKIQNLSLVKNRDNFSTKQSREKIQIKIEQFEKQLGKLGEEKLDFEQKIEKIKNTAEDNYHKKVDQFKKTIKPIEDSKKMVIEEKQIMQEKIDDIEGKIINLSKDTKSTDQELRELRKVKNEYIQIKIGLHQKMDEYKTNYPDELQLFYEEEKNKEEIKQLKDKQKTLKAELREANEKREIVRNEIVKLDDKINNHQDNYNLIIDNFNSASKVGESEIVRMESYINKKAIEYDAPTLTTLIDQV
jgi:chromosome segregation ATPase